jgi:hypothetical protein
VVLALVVGILGLLLLYSTVRATPPPFNANETTDVSVKDTKANSDVVGIFTVDKVPWPSAMYDIEVSFTPPEWGVAQTSDAPIGAWVGTLAAQSTIGLMNNPCFTNLQPVFNLLNCTIEKSPTVTYDEQFDNMGTLADGCTNWPDFLDTLFPGMTPRARMGGFTFLSGNYLSLNFLIFEPGTPLPAAFGNISPPADKGYIAVSVLNDPTAPLVPGLITDMCPPLGTTTTYYGLSKNNPLTTGVDESGAVWRTNPECPGTYTFDAYVASIRDVDGDGIDNKLDTCPLIANAGDPTVAYSGDLDGDGLDNACDPTQNTYGDDPDSDSYPNFQDNCPLVPNGGQEDGDLDGIGDACDTHDWNGDHVDDNTVLDPTTPNGERAEGWFPSPVDITGTVCATPTPTAGPGGTATATATASATATVVVAAETTLAEDAAAGDTEITVADATGFAVGDTIEIGTGATKETNTITAITDNTFTLATALEFDHLADEPVVKVIPVVLTPTPTVVGDICQPVFPGTYNGRVLIDGKPAQSGYQVTASIDDVQWGSAIVSGGRYAMDIPDHMPTTKPCFDGGTITFALNGMTCTPVEEGADEWHAGIRNVDLNCAPVAPPVTPTLTPPATPPATPTTVATPTVTPAKPPPTGAGGLSGSGAGLPLWATALSGWAGLMIVAGLGSLIAAKRR